MHSVIPSWLDGALIAVALHALSSRWLGRSVYRMTIRTSTRALRTASRFAVSDRMLCIYLAILSTALLMLLGYGYPG